MDGQNAQTVNRVHNHEKWRCPSIPKRGVKLIFEVLNLVLKWSGRDAWQHSRTYRLKLVKMFYEGKLRILWENKKEKSQPITNFLHSKIRSVIFSFPTHWSISFLSTHMYFLTIFGQMRRRLTYVLEAPGFSSLGKVPGNMSCVLVRRHRRFKDSYYISDGNHVQNLIWFPTSRGLHVFSLVIDNFHHFHVPRNLETGPTVGPVSRFLETCTTFVQDLRDSCLLYIVHI